MSVVIYRKVKDFIVDSFTRANKVSSIRHLLRAVYWVKKLRPEADEALLCSAIAHDVERATRPKGFVEKDHQKSANDPVFRRWHSEKGAEVIGNFLREHGIAHDFIAQVKSLVAHHEVGGDVDQNLLKDADSISFLENNSMRFVEKSVDEWSNDELKEKFDWMFKRITSKKAKIFARPYYEKALEALKKRK